jgi:hypothetical protein
MTDVTVNVLKGEWCVHFVITATQVPVGPWLLFESNDEIKAKVFSWGRVTDQAMEEYESDLRRWSHGSANMLLTDEQLKALSERKRGWPWTGYELIQMRRPEDTRLSVCEHRRILFLSYDVLRTFVAYKTDTISFSCYALPVKS